jgi:GT2 family glycosyltransferase
MKNTLNYFEWKNIRNLVNSLKTSTASDWHIHSNFFPTLIPFCAAINRADLEQLSGYDERFSIGIGFEDSDLDVRIRNLGLDIYLIDEPFCMHQIHPPIEYTNCINHDLFYRLEVGDANRTKAKHNKIYVR